MIKVKFQIPGCNIAYISLTKKFNEDIIVHKLRKDARQEIFVSYLENIKDVYSDLAFCYQKLLCFIDKHPKLRRYRMIFHVSPTYNKIEVYDDLSIKLLYNISNSLYMYAINRFEMVLPYLIKQFNISKYKMTMNTIVLKYKGYSIYLNRSTYALIVPCRNRFLIQLANKIIKFQDKFNIDLVNVDSLCNKFIKCVIDYLSIAYDIYPKLIDALFRSLKNE